MNITGKFVVFVEDKQTSKGIVKVFSTSVSRKEADGKYINASIGVRFQKENFPNERLAKLDQHKCYTFDVKEAWLDCRAFTRKDGTAGREIFISIKSADPVDSKEVIHKDVRADIDDGKLPF